MPFDPMRRLVTLGVHRLAPVSLALALALAGCGSDDTDTTEDSGTGLAVDAVDVPAEDADPTDTGEDTGEEDTEPDIADDTEPDIAEDTEDTPDTDDATEDTTPDTNPTDCFELADGSCVEATFANPPVLEPNVDGVYELEFGASEILLDGERHCLRTYNGVYPGPTIETGANDGETERSVRVDLINTFETSNDQNIDGEECTCVDGDGASCSPSHGGCEHTECTCTNTDGEECHVTDFNTTNLHAHGSHVRPDYSRGEDCEATTGDNGESIECRRCAVDVCDEDAEVSCYFADDVISTAGPTHGAQYRWDIDEDGTHHDGLQWYHPHIHGTTALQVASGAAGAWIVRGEVDEVAGMAEARERVFVYTMPPNGEDGIEPLEDGEECTADTLTLDDYEILHASDAQRYFVNGQPHARLVTAPGQVERWRFLHAGHLEEVFWMLAKGTDSDCGGWDIDDSLPLTQYARDGVVMPRPEDGAGWPFAPDYFFMSPGYRVESLFDGGETEHGDTYCLLVTRVIRENRRVTGLPNDESIRQWFEDDGNLVLTVNITDDAGPATSTTMPDLEALAELAPSLELQGVSIADRCAAAKVIEEPAEIEQLAILQVGFAEEVDACDCPNHNINCRNFDETDREVYPVDRVLRVGEVDHWRIITSFDGHPFHIHTNPFIACPLDEDDEVSEDYEPPFAHWRDTYQTNLDREVDLITEYRAFGGYFVQHCHKLTHEDAGMMELVRLCESEEDCGPYGWRYCAEGDADCERALAATECHIETDEVAACIASLDECRPALGPGEPCETNEECDSGTCTDPPGPTPAACE